MPCTDKIMKLLTMINFLNNNFIYTMTTLHTGELEILGVKVTTSRQYFNQVLNIIKRVFFLCQHWYSDISDHGGIGYASVKKSLT